jgi:hypothetical protein
MSQSLTVDDSNPLFEFDGQWQAFTNAANYQGGTYHYSNTAPARFFIQFRGQLGVFSL